VANYKVSMNKIQRQNVHRQNQNVTAEKQFKFTYINIHNNNKIIITIIIIIIIIIMIVVMMEFIMVIIQFNYIQFMFIYKQT
jgi:hypothetical protein